MFSADWPPWIDLFPPMFTMSFYIDCHLKLPLTVWQMGFGFYQDRIMGKRRNLGALVGMCEVGLKTTAVKFTSVQRVMKLGVSQYKCIHV